MTTRRALASRPTIRSGTLKIGCHVESQAYHGAPTTGRRRDRWWGWHAGTAWNRCGSRDGQFRRSAGLGQAFQLYSVDDQKLPAGFNITNEMTDILVRALHCHAYGDPGIDTLPLSAALFVGTGSRLDLSL